MRALIILLAVVLFAGTCKAQQLKDVAVQSVTNDYHTVQFIKQRTNAKWLQAGGAALSIFGGILAANGDDAGVPVSALGGIVSLSGFVVDLDAGKHRKRFKKFKSININFKSKQEERAKKRAEAEARHREWVKNFFKKTK